MAGVHRRNPQIPPPLRGRLRRFALPDIPGSLAPKQHAAVQTGVCLFLRGDACAPSCGAEIEEQFGAKVFDYYGSREVGAIAGECAARQAGTSL